MTIVEEIKKLKEEKDAVILAHYYVRPEVQEIADYIGDSFYLSKVATKLKEQTIVFCGVSFMGESAKILNPEKTVLMPDMNADCPMAPVNIYGMTEEFDMVAMETVNNQYLGGDTSLACSADTQKKIDEKVVEVVKEQHKKALDILNENKDKLHELANFLYEKETITGEEFMQILES